MPPEPRDLRVIQDLAREYADVASWPQNDDRRELWRRHFSLEGTRPLVLCHLGDCRDEILGPDLQCEDPFLRQHEMVLRELLFHSTLHDDRVFEPCTMQRAVFNTQSNALWGPPIDCVPAPEAEGSWLFIPPIRELVDSSVLALPFHDIDYETTRQQTYRLMEALGDRLTVHEDRTPLYSGLNADIATQLARLRGPEQVMIDMVDNPAWLHEVLAFMRDGILSVQAEAEACGDYSLMSQQNQAMPYVRELPQPVPATHGDARNRMWCFMAAQEFTSVSPGMHRQFLLDYQIPIMGRYGLVHYGGHEDLTGKIDMLRAIPNLRSIAVASSADIRACAER
ncbi:MAG: hypothetical protein HON70_36540, partial [Lentisphaerae bacterium]|nr:hypothetical protein [Lentisphaerota bacterium]